MLAGSSIQERADERMAGADAMVTLRLVAVLAAYYALAAVLGLALFLAATALGLFGGISILFYRGLAELAVLLPVLAVLLTLLLRLPWPAGVLSVRDAVAAAVVAIALNVTAFVLGPVTVDRSVSVFMLSRIEDAPAPPTAEELRQAFTARYLRDWDQVGRRLREQTVSGNVERSPAGQYRLTPQGRSFMRTARFMSRLFGGDPRFVGADRRSIDLARPRGVTDGAAPADTTAPAPRPATDAAKQP
jgi:hypothetical protein